MLYRSIYKVTDLNTNGVKIVSKSRIPWYIVRRNYRVELAYLFKGKLVEDYGWIEIKCKSFLM